MKKFLSNLVEFIWELIKVVAISLAIIIPIRYFLIQPFYVKGASMEPNFYDYEYLIVDEITYRFKEPKRGEIIILRYPSGFRHYFIKRIIALPKERIKIENGEVFIYNENYQEGVKLEEDYFDSLTKTPGNIDLTLKENEYFVLGDNRETSLDSRSFGPILRRNIVGKVWIRGFPFDRIKKFEPPFYNL